MKDVAIWSGRVPERRLVTDGHWGRLRGGGGWGVGYRLLPQGLVAGGDLGYTGVKNSNRSSIAVLQAMVQRISTAASGTWWSLIALYRT